MVYNGRRLPQSIVITPILSGSGDRNGRGSSEGSEARFASYVEALGGVLGHADRQQPMHDYCLGLLMPIARKSVEPMAAVTAPAQVAAQHQSLLHFVGNAPWSDTAMLAKGGEPILGRFGFSVRPLDQQPLFDTRLAQL